MFSSNLRTMSVGDRILEKMRVRGLRRGDVITATGATKGTISQWINNISEPSGRYLVPLCEVLDSTAQYLLYGEDDGLKGDNVSSTRYARGLVPLISKIQAGSWRQETDEFEPGDAEMFLPCPRPHSKHTYALKVEGDSMTSPHGRSLPSGCTVYCDPEQVAGVVSGDCVVAKLVGEDEVTFKQYYKDGKLQLLRPLNPSLPPLEGEFRILAKAVGIWIDI